MIHTTLNNSIRINDYIPLINIRPLRLSASPLPVPQFATEPEVSSSVPTTRVNKNQKEF